MYDLWLVEWRGPGMSFLRPGMLVRALVSGQKVTEDLRGQIVWALEGSVNPTISGYRLLFEEEYWVVREVNAL